MACMTGWYIIRFILDPQYDFKSVGYDYPDYNDPDTSHLRFCSVRRRFGISILGKTCAGFHTAQDRATRRSRT